MVRHFTILFMEAILQVFLFQLPLIGLFLKMCALARTPKKNRSINTLVRGSSGHYHFSCGTSVRGFAQKLKRCCVHLFLLYMIDGGGDAVLSRLPSLPSCKSAQTRPTDARGFPSHMCPTTGISLKAALVKPNQGSVYHTRFSRWSLIRLACSTLLAGRRELKEQTPFSLSNSFFHVCGFLHYAALLYRR